jgi:hypothetical protein
MRTVTTKIPPVIREIDGRWFLVVTDGKTEITAPIGSWFASQFMTRVVIPQLVLDAMKDA